MAAESLLDKLKRIEVRLTRSPWKLWGGEVRAPKPGYPDEESKLCNSELVAAFPLRHDQRPDTSGSHVMDAYKVAELRNLLPEIIAHLEAKDGR